jgi:hypothetical protein
VVLVEKLQDGVFLDDDRKEAMGIWFDSAEKGDVKVGIGGGGAMGATSGTCGV